MTNASKSLAGKVRWQLIIPTILFMLLSSIDRVNVSFAALQMNADLGFSPSQYGFGAGILFLGFLAGQYPSVLLLQRIGFHRWLAGCALLWGACAGGMAFIDSRWQFYVLRVLLGFAEGGLAPGIVLYLSQFATERERATTFAMPMLAIPISIVVGGPLSGFLLGMHPPVGFASWRWMFIGEALPTLIFAAIAWVHFPDRPADATWLSADEKLWLSRNAANRSETARRNDWTILKQPLVWASAALWFCLLAGSYGIIFWLPQMVKSLTSLTPLEIGLVNALPWAGNAIGIYIGATHSDRSGERFWHIAVPATVMAIAILTAGTAGASVVGLIALLVAGTCLGAAQGAFWALPTRLFTPATFAVGAVAINITGSSGGLIVPYLVGIVRERSGGFGAPTLMVAGFLLLASVIVLVLRVVIKDTPPPALPA
ncbi:MFS transporter [Sphingomonas sp. BIUV-7]|uniref:MFS transporter n=1 Tax=Sphingomonas natans TaxID=3063330 RepID=A0ABT8YA79_9SPHN|nr:MFS transporter [Sphingomonas sp. BIUV-7]MDO6415247.1 MFS transporter [Sphingomonas sp. BIUV-7]